MFTDEVIVSQIVRMKLIIVSVVATDIFVCGLCLEVHEPSMVLVVTNMYSVCREGEGERETIEAEMVTALAAANSHVQCWLPKHCHLLFLIALWFTG